MGRKARPTDPAVAERLRDVRLNRTTLSVAQFAELMGISQAQQSRYESAELSPDAVYLQGVVQKIPSVSLSWLLFGADPVPQNQYRLSAREAALIDNYRAAEEDGRRAIEARGAEVAKPEAVKPASKKAA